MEFKRFLTKYNFSGIETQTCSVNNHSFVYYCCFRRGSDQNDTVFAKYIIINLCDDITLDACKETIFKSMDDFSKFQQENISTHFFHEKELLRYNIYLLFVYNEYFDIFDKICNDLNYARKIFLKKDDFKNHFSFFDNISEIVEKNKENDIDVINCLKNTVNQLHSKKMKFILMPQERIKIANYFLNNNESKNYDKVFTKEENEKKFFENNFYKNLYRYKKFEKNHQIKKLYISSFRENCFKSHEKIDFGKVNVFYGENAIGKSSVLDAIEFAFTGETHKFISDSSLSDSLVKIEDVNKNIISSHDTQQYPEEYKRNWYNNKMGSLNELFCRINYFDTDATYRFALEEGDSDDAFAHLKKLLCDGKLIEIEKNLIDNIQNLKLAKSLYSSINGKTMRAIRKKHPQTHMPKNNFIEKLSQILFIKKIKLFLHKKYDYDRAYYNHLMMVRKTAIKEIDEIIDVSKETLETIQSLMNTQIELSLKLINEIFHRLYSYDGIIRWENESFELTNRKTDEKYMIKMMSTAQKVCLALSVIFAQFFIAKDSPRIILLDESVANFDALHLLNLFDFLRDITLNNIQIFFTTANKDVARISNNKFEFLGNDFYLYKLDRGDESKAEINKIN